MFLQVAVRGRTSQEVGPDQIRPDQTTVQWTSRLLSFEEINVGEVVSFYLAILATLFGPEFLFGDQFSFVACQCPRRVNLCLFPVDAPVSVALK